MEVLPEETDASLEELERQLANLRPARLSAPLLDRLASAMDTAEASYLDQGQNVVAFPRPPRKRPLWAAAAAVAVLGAAAALWVAPDGGRQLATSGAPKPAAVATPAGGSFVTAGYGRDVREAVDEGIVWSEGQVPHRRVRVVYIDKAVITNAKGEKIEVERPRVEWLLVPEKMD
jgi:hypothetical protein